MDTVRESNEVSLNRSRKVYKLGDGGVCETQRSSGSGTKLAGILRVEVCFNKLESCPPSNLLIIMKE